MIKSKYKLLLNYAGGILAIVSIVFVFFRLSKYWDSIPKSTFSIALYGTILGLSILYGCANILLIIAWKKIIEGLNTDISLRTATRIYGTSQLAKYIPGNIFQFAGRQMLAMANGFSGATIAKSTILELILLSISGALYCSFVISFFLKFELFPYNIALFFLLAGMVFFIIFKIKKTYCSIAMIYYVLFLFFSAIIFLLIMSTIANYSKFSLSLVFFVVGSYVIAWLAGLVTPGSPAGIGIRELVLTLFLGPFFHQSDIILAVIISRVVTVLGDCLTYLVTLSINDEKRNENI